MFCKPDQSSLWLLWRYRQGLLDFHESRLSNDDNQRLVELPERGLLLLLHANLVLRQQFGPLYIMPDIHLFNLV